MLTLDETKDFILIFGENGTGKSTVIDAIDMVCNLYAGSIKEKSSIRVAKHLPSIGAKPSDVQVELIAAGKTWKASLNGSTIRVRPADETPSVTVLRRRRILALVEATPSERFEQLKAFIDVDNIQKCEEELRKATREAKQAVQDRTQELATAEQNLAKAYEEDHSPEEEGLKPQEWAKRRIGKGLEDIEKEVTKYLGVIDAHTAATELSEQVAKNQKDLDAKRDAKQDIQKKIENAATIDARTGVVLVGLLEKASGYLERVADVDNCPVCLQPVDKQALGIEIRDRLKGMSDVVALAKEAQESTTAVSTAESQMANSYKKYVGKVGALLTKTDALDTEFTAGASLGSARYQDLSSWTGELSKEVIAEARVFLRAVAPIVEKVRKRHDSLKDQLAQSNAVKRSYKSALTARSEAGRGLRVQKALERMHEIAHRERIAYTQTILDAVADECDRLYAEIHPNEPGGGVRFAMDEDKRGSLNQTGRFGAHDGIVPQAYFSDSHLDTLGFCFFMAVTKHVTNARTTLIIDDVFTSVDLSHIKRILDLLLAEAATFDQIILATHQRRWLELFRTNQAPVNSAHLIELRPWSLDTGICGDSVAAHVDQLGAALKAKPTDRRSVGSLSGFLLESVLGEMTKHMNCSVKRNRLDRYTAYDLLCGIKKDLKAVTIRQVPSNAEPNDPATATHSGATLQALIAQLAETLNDVRNTVGDHFNWDAADIPNETIQGFGEQTLRLSRMLICDCCGSMARRDKKTHLLCSCSRLRIDRG